MHCVWCPVEHMDRTTEDPDARSHCKVNQLLKLMVSLLLYTLLQNHNLIGIVHSYVLLCKSVELQQIVDIHI